jgi:hypothetical protein
MAIIIDNDAIKFLEEFRILCNKYVKSSSLITMEFKDGCKIGMRTLLEVGLGIKQIKDVI